MNEPVLARWADAERILDEVLDGAAPDRLAQARALCGADTELASVVERLLAVEDSDFEPASAAALVDNALREDTPAVELPSSIGPFRVLAELGRGGMGRVLLAIREGPGALPRVAVKLLDRQVTDSDARRRFERERETMARLEHPNIARLQDGGVTADGVPFLVMEYVEGVPIDRYCEQLTLSIEARLMLVRQVCLAIEFAHGRLVVHRDLKPANVLVDVHGQVKLLDFGIAKWLDEFEADAHMTQASDRVLTPSHAAPEQFTGDHITAATDVYQLGLLMYELMTGRRPHATDGRTPDDVRRAVCDTETARPSDAPTPRTLARRLAGDLDAIVLKALRKDPRERYPTVEALRRDIDDHLAHRPVAARRGTTAYALRKYVRRHRTGLAAAVTILLASTAGLVGVVAQARRADRERDLAQSRLADVRRLASTLIFDVYDRVENSPNATAIRRSLVERGLTYFGDFTSDAAADVSLSLELAEGYRRLASVQGGGNANLGDRDGALASLTKARALLEPFRKNPSVPIEVEIADLRLLRETTDVLRSDAERRRSLAAEGVERAGRLVARYPERLDALEALGHSHFSAALAATTAGEKVSSWKEANRIYERLVSRVPGDPSHLRSLALTEKYLGAASYAGNDVARKHFERALELDRRVQALQPNSRQTMLDVAIDLGSVADIRRIDSALSEAASLFRESLALRERAASLDPQDVFARQGIGYCLIALSDVSLRMHDTENATAYGRRATEVYDSLPASDQVARRGQAWLALGKAEFASGRTVEGCRAYRKAHLHLAKLVAAPSDRLRQYADRELASIAATLASCAP